MQFKRIKDLREDNDLFQRDIPCAPETGAGNGGTAHKTRTALEGEKRL